MKKISVIIPMYNSEAYIKQCIRSVTSQTYQNLEILVIDDGSADGSREICEELSRTDERIRLYSQENGGVSKARNLGLETASGEYVFFLDSDDAIHPLLLEEMIGQAERQQAKMVFCDCTRVNSIEMESALNTVSVKDVRPKWLTAEGIKAEEWFHKIYVRELSGVWGLFDRDYIGTLRFDEKLVNGEDTLFKYHLFCKQTRAAYSDSKWYYYRTHDESATYSVKVLTGDRRFEGCKYIRDSEYQKGRTAFALTWENIIILQMRQKYEVQRKIRDREGCRILRKEAGAEMRSPLFRQLYMSARFLFGCCFVCYPLYLPLSRMTANILKRRDGA